tara:strand:+ start:43 stop:246 length:204 start_codon:yes stop_codon:yes gene_type:complete
LRQERSIIYKDLASRPFYIEIAKRLKDKKKRKGTRGKSEKAQGIKSEKAHGQWAKAHGQLSNGSDVA